MDHPVPLRNVPNSSNEELNIARLGCRAIGSARIWDQFAQENRRPGTRGRLPDPAQAHSRSSFERSIAEESRNGSGSFG